MTTALLRLSEVCARVGYRKSKIWELIKQGQFPKQIKLGVNVSVWRDDEVQEWINQRLI